MGGLKKIFKSAPDDGECNVSRLDPDTLSETSASLAKRVICLVNPMSYAKHNGGSNVDSNSHI